MVPALSYRYLFHGYTVIKGFIKTFGKFTYKAELKNLDCSKLLYFHTAIQ